MQFYVAVFVTFLAMGQARPGLHGGGASFPLATVPDIHSFGSLHYPEFDIQDLGTYVEGHLPPATITINNEYAHKVPEPYPVKIPYNVPVPVPVHKPYPVAVPHLVKVPHPVPVEVIKNVPVPVEVPKPYPVPVNEYNSYHGQGSYGGDSGSYGGSSQSYGGESSHSFGGNLEGGFAGSDSYGSGASTNVEVEQSHEYQVDDSGHGQQEEQH